MEIARITIKETMPHDGTFSPADVQATKACMVQVLFDQLIKNPLLFSVTSGADSVTIALDVGFITPDELMTYIKRRDNIKLLMEQL